MKTYCWCQCAPSLLFQTAPVSVVNRKTAPSLVGAEVSFLAFGGASLLYAGVNSIRTAMPAHCGLTFFHFLPLLRLKKRLPTLSRERNRLPCDTVAATGRPDGTAMARPTLDISATAWPTTTWLTLADSVWSCWAAPASTVTFLTPPPRQASAAALQVRSVSTRSTVRLS